MNALVVLSALVAVSSAAPWEKAGVVTGYAGLAHGYAAAPAIGLAHGYAAAPAIGLAHGYAAAPAAVAYSNVNAAVPAPLPTNGLSPGLPALVKKTAITAAGRPVTRITPHITRVEPEITHKRVDVPVPVPNPVAVRRPVPVPAPYPVTPVVETTEVVQPVVQPVVRHAVTAVRTAHVAAAPVGVAHGYAAAPAAVGYTGLAHGYAGLAHGYAAGYTGLAHGYTGLAHGYGLSHGVATNAAVVSAA